MNLITAILVYTLQLKISRTSGNKLEGIHKFICCTDYMALRKRKRNFDTDN